MPQELFRRDVVFHEGIVTEHDISNLILQVTGIDPALQKEVTLTLQFTLVDGSEISGISVDILNHPKLRDSSRIKNLNFECRSADGSRQITGNLKPIKGINFWPYNNKNTLVIEGSDSSWVEEADAQVSGIAATIKQRQTGQGLYEVLVYPLPFILSLLILLEVSIRLPDIAFSRMVATIASLSALSLGMLGCWLWGITRFRHIYPKLEIRFGQAEAVDVQRKIRFRQNLVLDLVIIALWLVLTILNPLRFFV